jgi:hypothetical protein
MFEALIRNLSLRRSAAGIYYELRTLRQMLEVVFEREGLELPSVRRARAKADDAELNVNDERCECDTLYACLSCGWRLGVYCPPHGPEQREEKIPMFDDLSGEVRSEIDELRTQRQLTEER